MPLDVNRLQYHLLYSISFVWRQGKKILSSIKEANSLELAKYYCVNCRCSAVTMPIKLDSYVSWSASELVAALRKYLVKWFCDFNAAAL